MSVENTIVKNIYIGNGATTEFPFTFQIGDDHPEYVIVYITNEDGITAETNNFTVNLETKNVTYPKVGEPLAGGKKITIYRKLPLHQPMNLTNQGPFFAENIEGSFDDVTFMIQQLNENLSRVMSASVDVVDFDTTFPVKAGKGIRVNDAGTGLESTEDPAEVLPLAQAVLQQTEQVKESAVEETMAIKNEAVEAKDTAVAAATTAAEEAAQQTVENITAEIDSKVAAAEASKNAAAQSASAAADSMAATQAFKAAASASANSASGSATIATEQADRAKSIADGVEGLAGIDGIATTEDAEAGESDNKAMTPLKTKQAIAAQMTEPLQQKADLVDGTVPEAQLPIATAAAAGTVKTGNNITNTNGTISITGDNVKAALGITPISANTNFTVTKSTQAAINPSVSSGMPTSYGITMPNVNTGLAAGTYTLQVLLQHLTNRSHSHTSVYRNGSNCNCDCDCDSD